MEHPPPAPCITSDQREARLVQAGARAMNAIRVPVAERDHGPGRSSTDLPKPMR